MRLDCFISTDYALLFLNSGAFKLIIFFSYCKVKSYYSLACSSSQEKEKVTTGLVLCVLLNSEYLTLPPKLQFEGSPVPKLRKSSSFTPSIKFCEFFGQNSLPDVANEEFHDDFFVEKGTRR